MKRISCACKGCEERKPNCHASCEKYKQFDEYRKTILNTVKKEKEMSYAIYSCNKRSK